MLKVILDNEPFFMIIFDELSSCTQWVQQHKGKGKIGLIPTMGALHEGHLSLVDIIRPHADHLIASIFVNPAQFAPHEDLATYPRSLESDLAALRQAGVDAVFLPHEDMIYPPDFAMSFHVKGVAKNLEGIDRPDFFDGVALIVLKLFHISGADIAVFGEKDFQQLAVIKQMVRDLDRKSVV